MASSLKELENFETYLQQLQNQNEESKEIQQEDFELCNFCCQKISKKKTEITTNSGRRIRKIDLHCHILPDSIPNFRKEFGYGGFISLKPVPDKPDKLQMWKGDQFFREIDKKCFSPEERIQDMDIEGVDIQVISTVPVMFSYWAKPADGYRVARFLNDHIAEIVKKYPNRFQGLGTLPMQHPKMAVQELIRCVQKLGLVGVEIGSHIEKWNLDDERFYPIWEMAQALDAAIFVHPWDMIGTGDMPKYWLPWLVAMPAETTRAIACLMFGGIFKKFPKLKFCFAHGGGSYPHTIGRLQHGYDCRPDLVQINLKGKEEDPMSYKGHFWVDSLVHDETALDYLVSVVGEKKVCLGTDYPFPLGECYPLKKMGELVEHHSKLSFEKKEQILWKNGLDFIGKDEKQFKCFDD